MAAPVPATRAYMAEAPPSYVRPYLVAHERRQEQARMDRSRLGVAVLADVARTANREAVSA